MAYIDERFLLSNDTARRLYEDWARDLPIVDFHNHLPPQDIAGDRRFDNLADAWLEDDHYKWRAMRSWGVAERFCTGDAPPQEKFQRWAEVVPHTLGNPLYHWTHLELAQYFGIHDLLDEDNAAAIYARAGELLQQPEYSVLGLLRRKSVKLVCTTDEPHDELRSHRQYAAAAGDCLMLPTLRLDGLLGVDDAKSWNLALDKLASVVDRDIACLEYLLDALDRRHAAFHAAGCRLSDVGIGEFLFCEPAQETAAAAFARLRAGEPLEREHATHLFSTVLLHASRLNAARGWVQQLHIGALRDANSRKVRALGQGRGFDSIGDWNNALALRDFLDTLNREDALARTILYNLNPADNAVFSTMAANFNEGDCRGKVQHGAAWWFLDQKRGIEEHLLCVSSLGLLSTFVGMVTDSRSFLSFSRHDYFRRILCSFLGDQAEEGLLPRDEKLLGDVIRRVCYDNARDYLPLNWIETGQRCHVE